MSSTPTWEWKREAGSPSSLTSDTDEAYEDVWLFGEGVTFVVEQDEDEMLSQQPATRAQVAAKLLEDLDERVKEEPFSDFSEARIDLPIFEDLPIVDLCPKYKSLDTETLLQEFDFVYGEVEFNNGSLLTPPQSPPYHHQQQQQQQQHQDVSFLPQLSPKDLEFPVVNHEDIVFFNTLSEVPQKSGFHVDDLIVLDASGKIYQDEIPATPHHSQDVATELAAVDELLRTRAEDMDVSSDPWECTDASSPTTNDSESEFAPSPAGSGSDNSCSGDMSNDPEWIPEAVNAPKAPKATTAAAAKRRRGKPYGRPVEDKKLRKKEQNKNAATRYRQKKKQEVEVILDEEKIMEDKNEDLREKVTDMQREIRYLKGLMKDLLKAKGILK